MIKDLKKNWSEVLLAFLIFFYTFIFSYFSIRRHQNYYSFRYDLGNMEQVIWNTSQGRIFQFTDPEGTKNISRLKYHADFLLIPIALIYKFFPYTETLLILQSFFISLGAIPIYYLAKNILKDKSLAFFPVIAYLFYPPLQRSNYYDFHAVTIATSLLLFTIYFSFKKSYPLFILFSFLAILTKEQIPITVALLSFYLAIKDSSFRRLGIAFSIFCLLYFYLIFFVVIPSYQVNYRHFVFKHFLDSESFSGRDKFVFNDFLKDKETYQLIKKLFLPLSFLPFLSPSWLFFTLPDLVPRLLSQNGSYRSIDFQYNNPIFPFIFIAFIFGIKKYFNFFFKRKINKNIALIPLLIMIIISEYYWSPFSGKFKDFPAKEILKPRPEKEFIDEFKKTVSEDKSVCVTNNIGAHFAKRKDFYDVPYNIFSADYVILLKEEKDRWLEEKIKLLKGNKNYKKVAEYKNFIAFERVIKVIKNN